MAKRKQGRGKKKKGFPWFKLLFTFGVMFIAYVIYLDARIMHRFNGVKWTLPALVYARPLEVFEGKALTRADFVKELITAGFHQNVSHQAGTFQVAGQTVFVRMKPFQFWDQLQPAMNIAVAFGSDRVLMIEGLPDTLHGAFRLKPARIGSIHPKLHEERVLIAYDDIPETLIEALLATEDRDFFKHYGISFKGILRAIVSNLKEGEITQGASTLTQQLVKNLFLTSERTFRRKIDEVIMAFLLEFRASKAEILEAYVNEVFVAQDGARAIHGFALASEFFFSKPLSELSEDQIALLVGMMKGPSYYNPIRHPARAMNRRNLVLQLMNEQGYLSKSNLVQDQKAPLGLMLQPAPGSTKSYAAYLQLAKQQLLRDYSQQDLQTQGLNIFTNLDPVVQADAQQSLNTGLKRLQGRFGQKVAETDGAVVVINHASGDIEALVGGKDFRPGSFNRALYASRPIGSLVKPAVYLTAIQQGYRLSDPLSDAPISLELNGKLWEPGNFDHKSHTLFDAIQGPYDNQNKDIPLFLAMAKSYNLATVRLGLDLGVGAVSKTLTKLGAERDIPQVPSLFLGAVNLTPMDVGQMFATIAGQGFYTPLNAIREVTDSQGHALKRYKIKLEKRFDTANMHLITYAMQAVIHEGTGRSAAKRFQPNTLIAGKTGTTNDLRDNWFAGFNNEKTAVVWIGNDDNTPLPMSAASGALPIWADLMRRYPSLMGRPPVPDDIEYQWIDIAQNAVTEEGCPNAVYLPFQVGTIPAEHTDCYSRQQKDDWFKRWFQ